MQGLKILVRATNWVGDAVMSLPALQAIRGASPDAHIAILARPWVADIYARESFADEVIPSESPRGFRAPHGEARLAAGRGPREGPRGGKGKGHQKGNGTAY